LFDTREGAGGFKLVASDQHMGVITNLLVACNIPLVMGIFATILVIIPNKGVHNGRKSESSLGSRGP
jgi:hypothetical protein